MAPEPGGGQGGHHNRCQPLCCALLNQCWAERLTLKFESLEVADHHSDATAHIAQQCGAEVRIMVDNKDKKAGALNWVLADILEDLAPDDIILVQDADSSLDATFIEKALPYAVSEKFGAVGGVFRGEGGAGFVGHLQRNEYTRYARDVRNLGGRCPVVTGTASMFRVEVLRQVVNGRRKGTLPSGDGSGGVYDTTVLTEDNEISFAIQTLGHKLVSPQGCYLVTEIMPSWAELWKQRLRWKRGAVENCFQYGITKATRGYWARQALAFVGLLIFTLYLTTLIIGAATRIAAHPGFLAVHHRGLYDRTRYNH